MDVLLSTFSTLESSLLEYPKAASANNASLIILSFFQLVSTCNKVSLVSSVILTLPFKSNTICRAVFLPIPGNLVR